MKEMLIWIYGCFKKLEIATVKITFSWYCNAHCNHKLFEISSAPVVQSLIKWISAKQLNVLGNIFPRKTPHVFICYIFAYLCSTCHKICWILRLPTKIMSLFFSPKTCKTNDIISTETSITWTPKWSTLINKIGKHLVK